MGLLEKAMKYKSEINRRGVDTLIDRIQGPADTDFVDEGVKNGHTQGPPPLRLTSIEQTSAGNGEEEITYIDESLLHELDEEEGSEKPDAEPIILDDDMPAADLAEGDDIFSLPGEDEANPSEILRRQKGTSERKVKSQEFAKLETRDDGLGEADGYRLSPEDPFGIDDAPVLGAKKKETPVLEMKEELDDSVQREGSMFSDIAGPTTEDMENYPQDAEDAQPSSRERQERPDKKFQDFLVLYEIGKEILRSENRKELYDVVLFSIMGQIGASSSSIMAVDPQNPQRWIIGDSRGVTIRNKKLYFDISEGILGQVISRRAIIDLDEFKGSTEYSEEYYKFVSVDARLLSPLIYGGNIIGAIVLGEKLTIGDYSEEEKDFIASVSEISAIALHKINIIEKLQEENGQFKTELDYIGHVESLKSRIVSSVSIRRLDEMISSEFESMGILNYAVFIDDEKNDRYEPIFIDKTDTLALRSDRFSISYGSSLAEYISELRECTKVDDHKRLKMVTDVFHEFRLKRMPLFWLYPFKFGSKLAGFLLVTDINDAEREKEIHGKLMKLSTVLFSYIMNLKALDVHENRYVDHIEPVLKRIDGELHNAKNLKIPLTVVLFSIKNFKRYYALYGRGEAKKIVDTLESIIRSRLSDPDFSVRFDRNKVLIVLPGKNKKFAVPLANTVRNEIIQHFKKKEMQLLVTFLTAEYPEDGEDLHALLDVID